MGRQILRSSSAEAKTYGLVGGLVELSKTGATAWASP
jgi:hypothetical protein